MQDEPTYLEVRFAGECTYKGVTLVLYTANASTFIGTDGYMKSTYMSMVQPIQVKYGGEIISVVELQTVIAHGRQELVTIISQHTCSLMGDFIGYASGHNGYSFGVYKSIDNPQIIYYDNPQSVKKVGSYIDGVFTTRYASVYQPGDEFSEEIEKVKLEYSKMNKPEKVEPAEIPKIVKQPYVKIKLSRLCEIESLEDGCPDIDVFICDAGKIYFEYAAAVATIHATGYLGYIPVYGFGFSEELHWNTTVMSSETFYAFYPKSIQEKIFEACARKDAPDTVSYRLHTMVDGWISRSNGGTVYDFMKDCSKMVKVLDMETSFKITFS